MGLERFLLASHQLGVHIPPELCLMTKFSLYVKTDVVLNSLNSLWWSDLQKAEVAYWKISVVVLGYHCAREPKLNNIWGKV